MNRLTILKKDTKVEFFPSPKRGEKLFKITKQLDDGDELIITPIVKFRFVKYKYRISRYRCKECGKHLWRGNKSGYCRKHWSPIALDKAYKKRGIK